METKVFILFQGEIFEGRLKNQTVFTSTHFLGISLNEIEQMWTGNEARELLTLNKKEYGALQ
ncbi:MAG: hypothetical protein WC389_18965 [Lutibacter sp.]|jgi:hypothetical protein